MDRWLLYLCALGCYPPPGKNVADDGDGVLTPYELQHVRNPLGRTLHAWPDFADRARGKVCLDFGCGAGYQVIGMAEAGASHAIGVDRIPEKFAAGLAAATARGLSTVSFARDCAAVAGSIDLALSQNSFEHFADPAGTLRTVYDALAPGGRFFITFGPPWKHPYGGHHFFMLKWPYWHLLFPVSVIMKLRQQYRSDAPQTWAECSLNQMTLAKFRALVAESAFTVEAIRVQRINAVPRWVHRLIPEYTTAQVHAILRKP